MIAQITVLHSTITIWGFINQILGYLKEKVRYRVQKCFAKTAFAWILKEWIVLGGRDEYQDHSRWSEVY